MLFSLGVVPECDSHKLEQTQLTRGDKNSTVLNNSAETISGASGGFLHLPLYFLPKSFHFANLTFTAAAI